MPIPPEGEIESIQAQICDLARRALIQAGDIQDVEEKLKGIVEKSSKNMPSEEAEERTSGRIGD